MPTSPGDQLGPYQILSLLGEGGMGQVWKARDGRLDRIVAIKTSHQQFNERFEREARAVAALNHPNVCTLHDIGPDYLVMEFVAGPTLADRIARGAMPVEEALPIARQIAEALEAAHEKGIIHRDLKPENVKFTSGGAVKVLDFGLAKATEAAHDPGSAPTITASASQGGRIVGTPAYMSPEQAAGSLVDKRTDIWAYGVVLWEMVTGRRMFDGPGVPQVLAAVLKDEPDIQAAPPALRPLLSRCLIKDPKKRMRDIGEARLMLDGDFPASSTQPLTARHGRALWVAGTAAMALIAALAGFALWPDMRVLERPLVRLDVDLGPDMSLGSQYGTDTIISPDGLRIVFVSKSRLFTRLLEQPKAIELSGTEGAGGPFFSLDGQWVAFFAGGRLKKISVEGGAAIDLCEAPIPRGGAWGEDHSIIASVTMGPLSRIPDAGGGTPQPQPVTELAQGEVAHRWPQILPGGKAVLFTASDASLAFDSANIEVMSFKDRRRKTLHRGGMYGRYLPTSSGSTYHGAGHLVYINKGTLFAVPFDPDTLQVRGTPVSVLQDVSYSPLGSAHFAFSNTGRLLYRNGGAAGGIVTLQWLDGTGKLQPLPAKPGPYNQPHLSPDGNLIAMTVSAGRGSDISTYDWQRDLTSQLTFGDGTYTFPVWSRDGRYLAFHADSGIFWTRADGAGKPQPLTQSKMGQFPWSFSGDDKRLAFAQASSQGGLDLWTVQIENDRDQLRAGKPEVFLQTSATESYPAFSPDGRWIAYRSTEAGSEIYVRAFPDNGAKRQISNGGGGFAVWSSNRRELFYRTQNQQVMVVNYTVKGDSFVPEKPRVWSEKRLADTGFFQNMDIAPDGKRFVALMPAETPGQQRANQLTLLLNFFDEVRRRAP